MSCRRVQHLLYDQLEGLASECQVSLIHDHLARCPACRQLQSELMATRGALRELARQRPVCASDLHRQAIDRWLAERQPTTAGVSQSARRSRLLALLLP